MKNLMIAGIGTDVGKTVVSAIIATAFGADYWKPIQSGQQTDFHQMSQWLNPQFHVVHSPSYMFQTPVSPHHAAYLEKRVIEPNQIRIPQTSRKLVIEGVGGVIVPLSTHLSTLDLFEKWPCRWIIVSKHYLGSINHTLLTVSALKSRNLHIAGIIFNGEPNQQSEEAILAQSNLPCIARLLPQQYLDSTTIQGIAASWKSQLINL